VARWIAAGANPKDTATRAGHSSVSFTLDRYGHLFPAPRNALTTPSISSPKRRRTGRMTGWTTGRTEV